MSARRVKRSRDTAGPPIVRTAQRPSGRLSRAATRVQGEVLSAGAELLISEGNRRRSRSDTRHRTIFGTRDRAPHSNGVSQRQMRRLVRWLPPAAAGRWRGAQLRAGRRAERLTHRISPGASVPPVAVSADASPRPRVLPAPGPNRGPSSSKTPSSPTLWTDPWFPPPGPVLHYPEHDT